jgi:hypothetical protein
MARRNPYESAAMAKRISKSIVRGLDRLKKVFGGAPEKSAASKKPAASKSAKRTEKRPAPPPADQAVSQADAAEAPEAKLDKKKLPAQPWFRHRQRW